MVNELRSYLRQCTYLQNINNLLVDYLGDEADAFSIEIEPTDSVVEEYINGNTLEQLVFLLVARLDYTPEINNNITNSELFINLKNWFREQNEAGNLPVLLDANVKAQKIEALTNGYLAMPQNDTAIYQIQCRLLYERKI